MTVETTAAEWARFEKAVENTDLGGFDAEGSLMTSNDLKFLLHFLREKRPVKVLEVGVYAGGTTKLLLRELSPASILYSVDVLQTLYDDSSRKVGHVMAESYDPRRQAVWKTYFGQDVSQCIHEIGGDIDFCIMDTTHRVPGEILSYLAVLPYLKDGAMLVLHDIIVHARHCRDRSVDALHNYYCTSLLFSAIFSGKKYAHRQAISADYNIGAVVIDKAAAMAHVEQVLNLLFMPWHFMPGEDILRDTLEVIREHYPPEAAGLFREIVHYHRVRPAQAPINILENARANCEYLLSKHGRLGVWAGDEQALREIVGEKPLCDDDVHLVSPEPGGTLAGKDVEPLESIVNLGLKTVLVPEPLSGGERARLFDQLTRDWGAEKVVFRDHLLGARMVEATDGLFRERIRSFLSNGAKVAFWGIGRRFKELMDEDLIAPANVYLVDRRPGGFYGGKPIEGPEAIRREGIETVVLPPVYRTPDGRTPAEEIRRELESGFGVKAIVHLDELLLWSPREPRSIRRPAT